MTTLILILKIIHIAAGGFALLSGLTAILLRKNVKRHKPMGKFYFWCMSIIFITSIPMALYKFNLFLFFINVFTYHAAITAFRSLKLKELHLGQKPLPLDWTIEGINIAANLGLIAVGIYYGINFSLEGGIIAGVFGLGGLRNSYANIKRLRGKIIYKNYWLMSHIGGMLGSYIGAITAFIVNNNRWMHLPEIVAWLGPTLLLVPLMIREINVFKKIKL